MLHNEIKERYKTNIDQLHSMGLTKTPQNTSKSSQKTKWCLHKKYWKNNATEGKNTSKLIFETKCQRKKYFLEKANKKIILFNWNANFAFVTSAETATTSNKQAEPWWRASIWRSHRKVVIKQCSYHNNIIDIQNRLPYSKVVYPAIIVLFSCLMEVNHGVRTGPDYPFR